MTRLAVIFAIALVAPVLAAPTTQKRIRPTEAIGQEGCVRAECHANVRSYAHLHGPVGTNACDACHEVSNVEAHTFRPTREKAELCTYCHEFDVSHMPVVHKPVTQGECLACHDPHGGWTKQLLREASVAELCDRCHESITRGMSFLHTPVAKGACESCHPPHASRFAKLLDAAGTDLCLACHQDMEARMQRAKFTHKAMESGCEKCHDVHGSKHVMATTQPAAEQCAGCHDELVLAAAGVSNRHAPMSDERSCTNCHSPHFSSAEKLVSDVPAKVCANCHGREIKTSRGTIVAAIPDPLTTKLHVHGALKEGECSGCHAPHGTNRAAMLTKFYSTRFYQRFSAEHYDLCSSCHDARLFSEPATRTATAFRNGETNLHALHVKLQGERGENCRVCHITHVGGDDRGVRQRILYGKWDMPMRFTRTPTGGACFPGCHRRYEYDRERPVNNMVTTRPVQMIARIVAPEPAMIELRARDSAGREIRVPDPNRATVLVVTRNADRTLDSLTPLAAPAQLVVIAAALPASQTFPTVSDADGVIANQLEVRAWPTAIIIAKDGSEIARVSGSIGSIALKLERYVDVATGRRTEPPPATTRASDVSYAQSSAAARQLFEAERLIAAGRFEEARQLLSRVLPAGHQASRAHYLMGQVLEHEGDWKGAAREYRAAH